MAITISTVLYRNKFHLGRIYPALAEMKSTKHDASGPYTVIGTVLGGNEH